MTEKHETVPLPRQYVLDTNVLISDPSAIYQFDEHDVVITMTVLEELDHIKDSNNPRHALARKEARIAIQNLKQVINGAAPDAIAKGIPIGAAGCDGKLRVVNDCAYDEAKLSGDVPDNRIISTALYLQEKEEGISTVLVTKDINLQLKSRVAGLLYVEDYLNEHQIDDIAYLAGGYRELEFDLMSKVEEVECTTKGQGRVCYTMDRSVLCEEDEALYLNQFLFDAESDHVFRVVGIDGDSVELLYKSKSQLMNRDVFGIKARSLLQALALESLMDPDIDLVQLTGPAGSGKTLLALAAALEQSRVGEECRYDRIVITRTATDMAEDIGFLPGTEEEKMTPWLAAFTDSLEVLFAQETEGNTEDKLVLDQQHHTIRMAMDKSNMQFKAVNFMRGRSLVNTFSILDESQNTTPHLVRSMVTRVGMGSKMVLLGNLGQIDAKYVTPLTSGLTHAVENMKMYEGGATMLLPGGERSRLSAYAEENL